MAHMTTELKGKSSLATTKCKEQFRPIYQEFTDFDHTLIDELLIGNPAIGVSAQSEDFVSRYKINTTTKAEKFLAKINKIVTLNWEDTTKQLENRLEQDHRLYVDDSTGENYAAMTLSKPKETIQRIEKLTQKARSSRGIIRERFLEIDSFFRHIRNSLAHGRFDRFQKDNQTFYFFQDQYKNSISAQLIISKTTLSELIKLVRKAN